MLLFFCYGIKVFIDFEDKYYILVFMKNFVQNLSFY